MGLSFTLKGYKGKTVRSAFSRIRLEIKGHFHIQGPQPVGEEGGAPEWVYELFKLDPDIEEIAINKKDSGVIYQPMK